MWYQHILIITKIFLLFENKYFRDKNIEKNEKNDIQLHDDTKMHRDDICQSKDDFSR